MWGQRAFTSAICNLKSPVPLLLCIALAGCAAPSPPLPPSLELPTPVTDLRAVRKGNNVFLTWTLPQETTDGAGIRFHGPTRICRIVTPLNAAPISMTSCGTPSAELASSQLETTNAKPSTNAPQRVSVRSADTLPADWMRDPSASITYAIESLNTGRHGAGLSNQVRVPAAVTEPPPKDFAAQLTAQGVVLTWTAPILAILGGDSTPHYFYRVFRATHDSSIHDSSIHDSSIHDSSSHDSPRPTLVGEIQQGMQAELRLVDNNFAWEESYEYRVNVTTRITTGAPHACPGDANPFPACKDTVDVEGEDSAPVTVVAHDTFPPAVPTALQAVFSGAGQKPFVDLTWNANTDADLVGYNVYRRDGTGQPVRINTELVRAPAFRDAGVVSGQTCFYSVSAIDGRGNESGRSEEATETVP